MYILFDIGGTKTRIAVARNYENFEDPVVLDTPQSYEKGLDVLVEKISELSNGENINGIIGGVAGPWSHHLGCMLSSHNLPDWAQKPIQKELENHFKTKVAIQNDSSLVGLGEAVFGAGKDFSIVAYITVSTGVGGARFVDGKMDEESVGFEPGNLIVNEHNETLESIISGKAIEAKVGKKAKDIQDREFWDSQSRILAVGLNNVIVTWSPDVVVVGGSLVKPESLSLEVAEKHLKKILKVYPVIPPIRQALLDDFGGLYGGLVKIKEIFGNN